MKTILILTLIVLATADDQPNIMQVPTWPAPPQIVNQNPIHTPASTPMPHRPVDAATEATHKRSPPQPDI